MSILEIAVRQDRCLTVQRDGREVKTEATAGVSAMETDECPRK